MVQHDEINRAKNIFMAKNINSVAILNMGLFRLFSSEPAKGPTIIRITPTSTTFRVTWSKLSKSDSNGVITNDEVCYQLGSTVSDCTINETVTGVDNTVIDITGLKPATMYTVAVRAFTAAGPGPLGYRKSSTTAAGGEYFFNLQIFMRIWLTSCFHSCMV